MTNYCPPYISMNEPGWHQPAQVCLPKNSMWPATSYEATCHRPSFMHYLSKLHCNWPRLLIPPAIRRTCDDSQRPSSRGGHRGKRWYRARIAIEFGRIGAKVALIARGTAGLAGAAREVEQAGGKAVIIKADVADAAAVETAVDRVE